VELHFGQDCVSFIKTLIANFCKNIILLRISCFLVLVFLIPGLLSGQELLKVANKQWRKALNEKDFTFNLKDYYFKRACLLSPKGEKEIKAYEVFNNFFAMLKTQIGKVKKASTLHYVTDKNRNILEVGTLKSKLKNKFAYVTAWHNEDGKLKKEVHLIYPISDAFFTASKKGIFDSDIDQARNLWTEFSNSHMPSKLLKILYKKDALYFNQGKLYRGFKEINPKYAYMSNQNWKINLYPEKVLQISETSALEIGHYVSNGKGHYILVWERDEKGTWKVAFDFNF